MDFKKRVMECVDENMEKDNFLEKFFLPEKFRKHVHKTKCVGEELHTDRKKKKN